jgi:glycosyltransferase involved in cell wall biosynthesis
MAKSPLVSIIITTKNEGKNIDALLKSINDQTYKNIEIIVVDNNSSDKTKEIAQKYTKNVFNVGPERSAQRNFGVEKSKGDYLLILDADMVLGKKVIEECIEEISKDSELKALVIPEKSFGEGIWSKTKAFERSFYLGDKDIEAARFFSKKVFNELGGFDLDLTGPEDWDLSQRVSNKYKLGRIQEFILHNEGRHTLFGLMKKKFYYAKKANQYLKKQKKGILSPTTIYFLRPSFYNNWQEMVLHPVLTTFLFIMLTAELISGGLGFLMGKINGR